MAVRLESEISLLLIQYDPEFLFDGCLEILPRFLRFPPKLPTDLASSPRAVETKSVKEQRMLHYKGKIRTLKRSPAQRAANPHPTTILLPPATRFLAHRRTSVHPASVPLCQSLQKVPSKRSHRPPRR